MHEIRQFAIYSRKSRFTGKGESIGNQIELCRQYIRLHYGETAAETAILYEDEGYSGGNTDRPQFRRMMRDAANGRLDAVVVYRLDRVSRNIGDFASLIEKLNERNVAFLSIREQFDTSSPMGRAMMYITSVFSQLERETIAERIRDNLRELAKTGRWLGGITPLGYRSVPAEHTDDRGKTYRRYLLQTDPQEMDTVRRIFTWTAETGSIPETVRLLEEHGYRTRRGESFSALAIRSILTNPVYMTADADAWRYLCENDCTVAMEEERFNGEHGVMIYNRTEQKKGKAHRLRPMEEWIGAVGEHKGIIPGAEWIRMQRIIGTRARIVRRTTEKGALLHGKVFCGCCGSPMRVKLRGDKREERRRYFYLCTGKEKSRGELCRVPNLDGNDLDYRVLSDVLAYVRADGMQSRLSDEEKRTLLRDVLRRIVWDGETADVFWNGSAQQM